MKRHLSAFDNKSFFIRLTDHFSFIYVDHFPEIVAFSVIAEAFGELHIKKRDDRLDVKRTLKAYSCKIILHALTSYV
jgi:hypothetical protein